MKKIFLILLVILNQGLFSQNKPDSTLGKKPLLTGGLRFQKAAGFYWMNGFSAEYSSPKICRQKISLAINFLSSRLGSAMASNAIPYYELDASVIKYFRNGRSIKPLLRLNLGYAHANYGSSEFSDLPQQSFIASVETGVIYDFKIPLRVGLTGGYNLITGNGMNGLGVLFPVYAQLSVFYRLDQK